jgi:hypothetical protein
MWTTGMTIAQKKNKASRPIPRSKVRYTSGPLNDGYTRGRRQLIPLPYMKMKRTAFLNMTD